MPTLTEIAERDEIVIFHPNLIEFGGFGERIFDARKYADLDKSLLLHILEQLDEFYDFVKLGNTFTVKEALAPFSELVRIVREKQEFLKGNPGHPIRKYNSKSKQKRVLDKFYNKGRHKKLLFDEIAYKLLELSNLLKSKTYSPEDKIAYRLFNWKIEDFLKVIGLKPTPEHSRFYVDALYLSVYENKTPALVVRGAEFLDGLSAIIKEISGQAFPTITASLQLHPIRLYHSGKDFSIVYTTQHEKPLQAVNP